MTPGTLPARRQGDGAKPGECNLKMRGKPHTTLRRGYDRRSSFSPLNKGRRTDYHGKATFYF